MNNESFQLPAIVSIGDLVADVIVSIPHLPVEAKQHQIADRIQIEPGGGANFLIAGARLGYPMAGIGVLGDDLWGHQVARMIAAEGVDMSAVRHSGTTTTVIVLVGQAGDHVFLGQYGHGPVITVEAPMLEKLGHAGAIFCAGYTLREQRLLDLTLEAMHLAKQNQIPVYFDPGPQITEVTVPIRTEIVSLIDVLLGTDEEIALMVDRKNLADLMRVGPHTIVMKRGPQGCVVYENRGSDPAATIPGHPVPVVDTSGAGDSFNAAFMVARLRGWTVIESARLANVVGAAKVQKLGGGCNMPTLAEITELVSQFNLKLPALS
jgi:ribokinase